MTSPALDSQFAARALRWLDNPIVGAFLSPRGLDDYLELLEPTWTLRTARARILAVRRETAECTTLVLGPGLGFDGFFAGQHVALTVELAGRSTTRVFSIASPEQSRELEITIKRTASGTVSRWAGEAAKVGDVLTLGPASGNFVLPTTGRAPLLFVAGGSGITPIRSLVETALARGHVDPIGVLLYAQSEPDAIYLERFRGLSRAHSNLAFRFVPTRGHQSTSTLRGRFRDEHVESLGLGSDVAEIYACGPESLLRAITSFASTRGSAIHTERFHLPSRIASDGRHAIRFLGEGIATEGDDATPILLCAESSGLALEHGCRRGLCHRCVRTLARGAVRNLVTGEVDAEPGQRIRLCISAPTTDVEIDE